MVRKESRIDEIDVKNIAEAYNPWWSGGRPQGIPSFKRDVFGMALEHLEANHGLAFLINGPRRVGKTTIMRQLMDYLVADRKVAPERVFFFSLDDPFIQQLPDEEQGRGFELLLEHWEARMGHSLAEAKEPVYCFLDEVQRLPRWELYIKRYVDLQYPVRFVVSGSASHTIFRKSLESLLGRVVEVSLPPFSFREYVRFRRQNERGDALSSVLLDLASRKVDIKDVTVVRRLLNSLVGSIGKEGLALLDSEAVQYARDGGFPQLWGMTDIVERSQFIDTQFVQQVTLEDLRLIREIRRPETFHRFLRYAFACTGDEYELTKVAKEISATRQNLADALPLLLQTDLLWSVERYSGKAVRLRTTHAKLYATDTSLYEGIKKAFADLNGPDKGRLTETLVLNVLRRLPGITEVAYLRLPKTGKQPEREVDFVVRVGQSSLPVEVKGRDSDSVRDKEHVRYFIEKYHEATDYGLLINRRKLNLDDQIMELPLGLFLLLA